MKAPNKEHQGTVGTIIVGRMGAIPRPAFADSLKFPDNITALNSANVSELLGKYTAMYAYASHTLSRCQTSLLAEETKQRLMFNKILRERPQLNTQERWRRDTCVETDPRMEACDRRISELKQERAMLETYAGIFDKYVSALSRELTRKSHEVSMHMK